jgi:hypothetical protein
MKLNAITLADEGARRIGLTDVEKKLVREND